MNVSFKLKQNSQPKNKKPHDSSLTATTSPLPDLQTIKLDSQIVGVLQNIENSTLSLPF